MIQARREGATQWHGYACCLLSTVSINVILYALSIWIVITINVNMYVLIIIIIIIINLLHRTVSIESFVGN